jgi:hypothetical protein
MGSNLGVGEDAEASEANREGDEADVDAEGAGRGEERADSGLEEAVELVPATLEVVCLEPALEMAGVVLDELSKDYSSNLARYDFETHDHYPNVRHPSQQPHSTDCLLDVVRSSSQIRLDSGPLRKLDRCSKAPGIFRSTCCRLGYLYSTCSGY